MGLKLDGLALVGGWLHEVSLEFDPDLKARTDLTDGAVLKFLALIGTGLVFLGIVDVLEGALHAGDQLLVGILGKFTEGYWFHGELG